MLHGATATLDGHARDKLIDLRQQPVEHGAWTLISRSSPVKGQVPWGGA